ncbi:MAG: DUF1475 domain-containing protein [Acidimicrobiia bacterium]|nr:DUF1475 domain-containing protein [Acidimicrobiia bacterium]
MNGPRTLGLIVTVITGAMVVVAMTTGSFSVEGDVIASLAWGKMTLVDLYGGLALFAGWIWHRHAGWVPRLAWTVALIILGNLAAGIYVVWAARASSWPEFWSGASRSSSVE